MIGLKISSLPIISDDDSGTRRNGHVDSGALGDIIHVRLEEFIPAPRFRCYYLIYVGLLEVSPCHHNLFLF